MSRTISEIYNSVIAEKETFSYLSAYQPSPDDAQTFLTNLTSTSKVGVWRCMVWVVSTAIWIHEGLWDIFEAEINATAQGLIPGTPQWYVNRMKEFQYGSMLVYNTTTEKFEYEEVDTDLQIIVQAAVVESNGLLVIKVAKSDGSTGLEKLSSPEELAADNYLKRRKFAGTLTSLITDDADDMKLYLTVYIDNTIIYNDESNPGDALNGSLLEDSTIFPIENAIKDYLHTLNFNGIFIIAKIVDDIQAITGVSNIVIDSCNAKYGSLSYSDILATTAQSYQSNAGYIDIDGSYPLSDTITYLNQ